MDASRQLPESNEVYLDHVGWFIADVEAASRAFGRLGFGLTPFVRSRNADPGGGPPVLAGTGNRCAMLPRGYLELIAAIDGVDTALARQHRAAVAHHVGVHVLAFTVADPGQAHARLAADGFTPGLPVHLRRPVTDSAKREAFAEFTVIRVPPEEMPEGRIQLLTHHTPELVWQERFLNGENGIQGLSGAVLCVPDADAVAERYARFLGRTARGGTGARVIGLDRGQLAIVSEERWTSTLGLRSPGPRPAIAGVSFIVNDLRSTVGFLEQRGVPVTRHPAGVLGVSPEAALNAVLILHQAGDDWTRLFA